MDRKKLLLIESSEKVIKPAKLVLFVQSEKKKMKPIFDFI